jgi:hypothetical protein
MTVIQLLVEAGVAAVKVAQAAVFGLEYDLAASKLLLGADSIRKYREETTPLRASLLEAVSAAEHKLVQDITTDNGARASCEATAQAARACAARVDRAREDYRNASAAVFWRLYK